MKRPALYRSAEGSYAVTAGLLPLPGKLEMTLLLQQTEG